MYYNVKLDSSDPLLIAGWRVATIPVITHSEQNRDKFSIPMRDGELVGSDIWRSNAYITVTFHSRLGQLSWNSNFRSDTMDMRYARLLNFLNGKSYLHIQTQNFNNHSSYDEAGKFELVGWKITNETRINRDYIRVEVQFEVYPFKFLETTQEHPLYTTATSIENNWDESMPLYELNASIDGIGGAFSLTVNNYTMSGNFPSVYADSVYIDTRKQIAYYETGGYRYELPNVSGDFTKLRLPARYTSTLSKTGATTLMTYTRFGVKI